MNLTILGGGNVRVKFVICKAVLYHCIPMVKIAMKTYGDRMQLISFVFKTLKPYFAVALKLASIFNHESLPSIKVMQPLWFQPW